MTTLSRERLLEIIQDISELTTDEEVHVKAVSISMSDIDEKSRGFLSAAIDLRRKSIYLVSCIVVEAEITAGEIE